MKNQDELIRLKKRWHLFNDFMNQKYKEQNIYNSIRKIVDEAYEKGKINILRSVNKDIDRDLKEMPLVNKIELKKIFYRELKEGIEDLEGFYKEKIMKIITRKKIKTSDEFELVQCYLKREIFFENIGNVDDLLKDKYIEYIKTNYKY